MMRHFYFRLVMGFVFLVCLMYSALTLNTMGIALFIFMSIMMFYGAYQEWKRNSGGKK